MEASTSAQSSSAAPASLRAARTRYISVWFTRSSLPFCCDLYGAVITDVMPVSSYHTLRSLVTYSLASS